jgi:anti-sigma B factor antagonist
MTASSRIVVKKLPENVTAGYTKELFDDVVQLLHEDRPNLVLDFSQVARMDSAGIDVLLRCTEEAMKRNGDIKLAAVSPEVAAILELTRVHRLFQIFENSSEAIESFHRFTGKTTRAKVAERGSTPRSEIDEHQAK